ncbi:MAG: hypothetical protein NT001_05180, partial [Candidatus Woesearchaeota archaeon]|nr:hypothetical protein [Candidatus Woesearchaeota archaeon]
ETMSVPDDDSLSKYLRTLGMKDDLVHFLNRFGHEVTPYEGGMRKDFPNIDMEDVLRYSLPKDFPKVGCKTAAGAIVPQAHPELEVIVVRADGTTLLFDRYGLREQISDFDAETSTATYTCYRNKDGKPNWDANKYIVPALKVAIDKYGRDAVGNCVYLDCKLKSRQDEKVHHPQMQTTTLHPDDFEEHHDRYELPPHVVMAIDLAA